jgi:hypothetical protein
VALRENRECVQMLGEMLARAEASAGGQLVFRIEFIGGKGSEKNPPLVIN